MVLLAQRPMILDTESFSKAKSCVRVLTSVESIALLEEKARKKREEQGEKERKKRETIKEGCQGRRKKMKSTRKAI